MTCTIRKSVTQVTNLFQHRSLTCTKCVKGKELSLNVGGSLRNYHEAFMVWYGMVRYGTVRYLTVRYNILWYVTRFIEKCPNWFSVVAFII